MKKNEEKNWEKYGFIIFMLAVLLLYYYFNFLSNSRYLAFLSKMIG